MMPFMCSSVFFCISEKEGKGEEQSVAGTHRDVSFFFSRVVVPPTIVL